MPDIQDIIDNFDLLDDWEDRYKYLIELGKMLEPLPDVQKNECTKVSGCASQVWLVTQHNDDHTLSFRGESDAHIVKGLIAILIALYSEKKAKEILQIDPKATFETLQLGEHLSQQRANGLASMVARIRKDAAVLAQAPIAGET
jgi:cysteine desulfuration protein SufE